MTPPPPTVPMCRVANSRTVLSSPITSCGVLAGVLEILRHRADRGELEDAVALAEGGVALDDRVGADRGALADRHLRTDDGEGADLHRGVEPGLGVDDRGGVDVGHLSACLRLPRTPRRRRGVLVDHGGQELGLGHLHAVHGGHAPSASRRRPCGAPPRPRAAAGRPGTTGLRNLAPSMAIR